MHLWLDEAMEGPNPASILRNSVVVTCGALVLLKVMPILQQSPIATSVLLTIGSISALGGSLVSIAQVDMKRAFSYTTTSYMGLVFIAIALQLPSLALLLLFAHAVAKALLMMSVGSVIATTNCQDITELGGLGGRMPATTGAYLVAGAGLTGLLPLGCFWCFGLATDVLVQQAPLFAAVFLATNALMAWNLTRVYRQVFLGTPQPKTKRAPEVNWQMALPMVALSVVVVLTPALLTKLNPVPGINSFSPAVAAAVIASSAAGVLVACLLPVHKSYARSLVKPVRLLQDLLAFDFYTDRFYRLTIVNLVSGMARLTNWVDQVVVNGFVNRLGRFSLVSADGLKLSVSGQTQTYVLTALMAVVLLLASLNWVFG